MWSDTRPKLDMGILKLPSALNPTFVHTSKLSRSLSEELTKDEMSKVSYLVWTVFKPFECVVIYLQFDANAFREWYDAYYKDGSVAMTYPYVCVFNSMFVRILIPKCVLLQISWVWPYCPLENQKAAHLHPTKIWGFPLSLVPTRRTQLHFLCLQTVIRIDWLKFCPFSWANDKSLTRTMNMIYFGFSTRRCSLVYLWYYDDNSLGCSKPRPWCRMLLH